METPFQMGYDQQQDLVAQEKLSPGALMGCGAGPAQVALTLLWAPVGLTTRCVALQVQLPDVPPGWGPCGASPVALIEMTPCQLGFLKEMYNNP